MKFLNFKTFEEFCKHFSTEKKCQDYFKDMRFGKEIICPYCSGGIAA